MTVKDFGRANNLSNPALKGIFELQVKSDLQKKLSEYGTANQIKSLAIKKLALAAEHGTKNWVKIMIKFVLWFAFLIPLFILFRRRKINSGLRKWLLFISVLIFGVIMGSDPSPMGPVKDAIHLYGSAGAIFPPRMIALTVFLVIVFAANKYICAWGADIIEPFDPFKIYKPAYLGLTGVVFLFVESGTWDTNLVFFLDKNKFSNY